MKKSLLLIVLTLMISVSVAIVLYSQSPEQATVDSAFDGVRQSLQDGTATPNQVEVVNYDGSTTTLNKAKVTKSMPAER